MRRPSLPRTLRVRLILVLLLGGLLPLGSAGAWILYDAGRQGEALLRERLRESVLTSARSLGQNWVQLRSQVLDIVPLLLDEARLPDDALAFSEESVRLPEGVYEVVVSTPSGRHAVARASTGVAGSGQPLVPLRMTVWDPEGGEPRAQVSVSVAPNRILPEGPGTPGLANGIFTMVDRDDGRVLIPSIVPGELLERDRFVWAGDDWVAVRRSMDEPRVVLVSAGALGPFRTSLTVAAKRGAALLLTAGMMSVLLVLMLTGPTMRTLTRMGQAAERVSGGDLDVAVPTAEGGEEVARLARAFNAMTGNLRSTLDRLSQREALAAMGELAATLAHEVRNPLTSIRLDLERAAERIESSAPERGLVDRSLEEVRRLDESLRGALTLAKHRDLDLQPVDLREVVDAALHAAAPSFSEAGVEVRHSQRSQTSVPALGNASALQQILLNLLLNAAQASERGGVIAVSERSHGGLAEVVVRDEGEGMDPATLERSRDVLFTTRPGGTGLGLSVASRLAKAHGGALELESEPGRGTTARLLLPSNVTDRDEPDRVRRNET